MVACSASGSESEAKTLHASAAAATRSTHTSAALCDTALCVESAAEQRPSPAFAAPFASVCQHQPSVTAASIHRGSRAFRPQHVWESRQSPPVMSLLTTPPLYSRYHLMGVLGWLYLVGYPRICFQVNKYIWIYMYVTFTWLMSHAIAHF